MKYASLLTAFLIAPLARAGQQFSFSDPILNGSFSNYMFETNNLVVGNINPTASILNAYTGTVSLTVDSFTSTGAYSGSITVPANYYLSKTGSNSNGVFGGGITSGLYAGGPGSVIFVNPNDGTQVYFKATFAGSTLSFSPLTTTKIPTFENLSATPTGLSFTGSLFTTTETGNINAGFGLLDRFTQGTNTDLAHHTGTFYASVGTIGVIPVPEPSSWLALSAGTLILLRRHRRA